MATFVTADTRTDVKEINERIINRWNSVVMPEETVFHLGNVGDPSIVKYLNGHKILIMSSVDQKHSQEFWRDAGFDEVSRFPIIYNDFIIFQSELPEFYSDDSDFAWIYGRGNCSNMSQTITRRTACVSLDRWNYTPVELNSIIDRMKELS